MSETKIGFIVVTLFCVAILLVGMVASGDVFKDKDDKDEEDEEK